MSDAAQFGEGGFAEFVLVDLGGMRIGVPTEAVVQAIACPAALTRLPRATAALEGVFQHAGEAIPLINLMKWMGNVQVCSVPPKQVLILRAGDLRIGIQVASLQRLWRTPVTNVRRIHHDHDPQELFHSVASDETSTGLVSLLDPARLMARAQVWSQEADTDRFDSLTGTQTQEADNSAQSLQTYAVFRIGEVRLGLPAGVVGEVTRKVPLQRMSGLGKEFLGICKWRSRDMPLLDLSLAIGLPVAVQPDAGWQVMLDVQGQCLSFCVDEICAVQNLSLSSVQARASGVGPFAAFVIGSVLDEDGQRVQLLDVKSVMEACPLFIAHSADACGTESLKIAAQSAQDGTALVVVQCRQGLALPMDQLREIVRLPDGFLPNQSIANQVVGMLEWRGIEVPMVDLSLAAQSQTTEVTPKSRAVIVDFNNRVVALIVEDVLALIPGFAGTHSQFRVQGKEVLMVTLGQGTEQQSYQIFDVRKLACFAETAMHEATA